jgi:CTP synthase
VISNRTLAYKIYGESTISERHRHRYEYNSAYVDVSKCRIESVRVNPDTGLVEIVELEDHPFSSGYNTIQNIKVPLQTHILFL